jgi:DNA-binding NtrC family response regulator
MRDPTILVVDDEKNTRLSLEEALRPAGYRIISAADGAEALARLEAERPALMLLDLQLPELDGMEVLRRAAHDHPEVRVVIITAHGSVGNAIEAMKLGAIDFLQKPFSLAEVRTLVASVLDRERLDAARAASYDDHIGLARRFITQRHFEAAAEHARRAVAEDASRPDGFNLLGVLHEVAGNRIEALKHYRIALETDPSYRPAQQNLARATQNPEVKGGPISYT